MKKFWFFFAFIVVLSAVILVFLVVQGDSFFASHGRQAPEVSQAAKLSLTSTDAPSVGPKNAKVTVVEFFDFQCPYSKEAAPVVKQLIEEYSEKSVRFEFRHLPLAKKHPLALPAARAAMCAHEQGREKFTEMYDLIFEKQEKLSDAYLANIAQQMNLDLLKFNTCLSQDRYRSGILNDLADSGKLNIEGTPTFFINAVPVVGAYSIEVYRNIIDEQLRIK